MTLHKGIARICDQATSKRIAQSLAVEQRRLLWTGTASELPRLADDKAVVSLWQDVDSKAENYDPTISYRAMK